MTDFTKHDPPPSDPAAPPPGAASAPPPPGAAALGGPGVPPPGAGPGIMTVLAFALYVGGLVAFAYQETHPGQPFVPIVMLCLLGLVVVHGVTGPVFAVIGTTKANSGQWWSYPKIFAMPFVKD